MQSLNYGSLFSGCGLLDSGLDEAGWRCAFLCEKDRDCRRVLAKHWPGVECHDDVATVDPLRLPAVDLLVGGSPCQGLSVAGRGEGLADERSGLFVHFVRLADVLATRWLLWENVPGALSSCNGRDFACVLAGFTGFRPEVPPEGWQNAGVCWGPKRGCAWRVLDASRVGGCPLHCDERGIGPVPQSRRRIFLVAYSGDGTGLAGAASRQGAAARLAALPAEVLFEPESCAGDFTPRRPKRKDVAATLRSRTAAGRGVNPPGRGGEDDHNLIAGPLMASTGGIASADRVGELVAAYGGNDTRGPIDRATSVNACKSKSGRIDFESETFVVATLNNGDHDGGFRTDGLANAVLNPARGGRSLEKCIATRTIVRRLTPTECLRLMGAPDDYLDLDPPLSDSAKYRMVGNAAARNVLRWIGQRLRQVHSALAEPRS